MPRKIVPPRARLALLLLAAACSTTPAPPGDRQLGAFNLSFQLESDDCTEQGGQVAGGLRLADQVAVLSEDSSRGIYYLTISGREPIAGVLDAGSDFLFRTGAEAEAAGCPQLVNVTETLSGTLQVAPDALSEPLFDGLTGRLVDDLTAPAGTRCPYPLPCQERYRMAGTLVQ